MIRKFLKLDRPTMGETKNDRVWMTNQLTTDDYFERYEIEKLETLFSKITELDDETLYALNYYYREHYDYYMFTPNYYVGGRKLTRHRKSNAKSKSKRKHKRRSFKKSSHRRQRH